MYNDGVEKGWSARERIDGDIIGLYFFASRRRHTRLQGDWSSDVCFFFSSRRRHTRLQGDWSSDVCSSDLLAVWAVVVRNALMASRNVFFFFELLFWPIVGVLSIGLMTRFLHLTPEQASFVLIGTIALSVVNVCQLEVAYAVLLDVWSKSLKHQFLAPIGIRHLTLGSWLVGMARGGALFLLLAALGWWAFDFRVLAPGRRPVAVFVL